MIDRINDTSSYQSPYSNMRMGKIKADENVPPFLLDYDEKGVVWERSTDDKKVKTDQAKADHVKKTEPLKDEFIRSNNQEKAEDGPTFDIVQSIKEIAESIRDFFKSIMDYMWYGTEENEESVKKSDDVVAESSVETSELVSSMDEPVSKDGKARVKAARSSGLLTTYDRFGKISKPSAAESRIILKGDKYIEM